MNHPPLTNDRRRGDIKTVEPRDRAFASPPGRPGQRNWAIALTLFVALLGIYHLDGDFQMSNDSKPNMHLAMRLLKEGRLTFTPEQMPFMFVWRLDTPYGPEIYQFRRWDQTIQGRQPAELRRAGLLSEPHPRYYIVPSKRMDPETGKPLYVNTFGPGAALTALPVYAVVDLLRGNLSDHLEVMIRAGKFVAAAMVAASAGMVFLTVARFTSVFGALLAAVAYGLGTCVWSVSSQTLWQHGPNEFFLAMGTLFLVRLGPAGRWRDAFWCGLAYSAAVVCRPTSVIVVVAAGAYLLISVRRLVLPYVLAALPLGLALGAYNTYYLGSPLASGQGQAGKVVAEQKTGSQAVWQTPLAEGAAGLLFSPSRGLLVFSPWVAFAFAGVVAAWRRRGALTPLLALTVAILCLMLIAFKWFDWWGGWCFGYRPIVDTMPLLAVMLIPVIEWVRRRKAALVAFGVLLAWSVFVQVLGVWAYNMETWNGPVIGFEVYTSPTTEPEVVANIHQVDRIAATRPVNNVRTLRADIDMPEYRHRLWSLRDNQIGHLIGDFGEARSVKKRERQDWLQMP